MRTIIYKVKVETVDVAGSYLILLHPYDEKIEVFRALLCWNAPAEHTEKVIDFIESLYGKIDFERKIIMSDYLPIYLDSDYVAPKKEEIRKNLALAGLVAE